METEKEWAADQERQAMDRRAAKRRLVAISETREPWFDPAADRAAGGLIFLDFDGVLHPLGEGASSFSQADLLMEAILAIEESSGAAVAIALVTSWRFQPMASIKEALSAAAPGLGERVEGRSGSMLGEQFSGGCRLAECLDYLAKRPGGAPAWHCALDDQPSIFERPAAAGSQERLGPPAWLIACDSNIGIDARAKDWIKEAGRLALAGEWPPESPLGKRRGGAPTWVATQRSRL